MRKCEAGKFWARSHLDGTLHEPWRGPRTVQWSVQATPVKGPQIHSKAKPNGPLNGPCGGARPVQPPVEAGPDKPSRPWQRPPSTSPKTRRWVLHGPLRLPWRDAFDSHARATPRSPQRTSQRPVEVCTDRSWSRADDLWPNPIRPAKGAST